MSNLQIEEITPKWIPATEKGRRYWQWIREARQEAYDEQLNLNQVIASQNAVKLIIWYETGGDPKRYLNAYWDKHGKVWTIGIGSTLNMEGQPIKEGDKITLDEAYQLLDRHLQKEVYPILNKLVNTTQEKFDSFLSLIYNIGINKFKESSVLRFHNSKKPADEIKRAFLMWNKAGGVVLPGLICRRMSEADLYNTGQLVFYGYDKKTSKYYKVKGL